MDQTTCVKCLADEVPEPRAVHIRGLCRPHYTQARKSGELGRAYAVKGAKETCSVDGCDKPYKARGYCASHYARKYRTGGEPTGTIRVPPSPICTFDGCDQPNSRRGLCAGHNAQQKRGKDLTPLKVRKPRVGVCSVHKCLKAVQNGGLCGTHYNRKRAGEPDWDRPIKDKAPDGTGHVDENGYRQIYVNGRAVGEHRVVMEQMIGRPLLPTETVHHKKGGFKGRSNNRPENLELWTGRHPKGHRVEDVVEYCREMLAVYGNQVEQALFAEYGDAVRKDRRNTDEDD